MGLLMLMDILGGYYGIHILKKRLVGE